MVLSVIVLANKLGITDPAEMDDIELDLLNQLYNVVINSVLVDQPITIADIREWHRRWHCWRKINKRAVNGIFVSCATSIKYRA
ncbi:hypothetical protein [Thiogranum longum]|uniref:hypothetical protein n=1 Tax=Thiogranum longum TaxID=1537524 RepID=UPI001402FE8D|nr:hypothetical protein [Thiogranum longum]